MRSPGEQLAVFKALGDNTRYAIYLELARSPVPLATADVADALGLHPNTVRPHLERMRDVGLLDVEPATSGGVGRPQHLYSLAADAPSLGLEPPAYRRLAGMLALAAARAGVDADEAVEVGRLQGRADASGFAPDAGGGTDPAGVVAEAGPAAGGPGADRAPRCLAALVAELTILGFDPAVAGSLSPGAAGAEGSTARVAFTHCPYRELAEAQPELVCSLHRGMVEGFVESLGGAEVAEFHTLVDREPCQVELSGR